MADNPDSVFFIDSDLVERLMRGDTADLTKKKPPHLRSKCAGDCSQAGERR